MMALKATVRKKNAIDRAVMWFSWVQDWSSRVRRSLRNLLLSHWCEGMKVR